GSRVRWCWAWSAVRAPGARPPARTVAAESSSQAQPPSVLTAAATASLPTLVDARGHRPAVRAELIVLPPSPQPERDDHGRAEEHRRNPKRVPGPLLALKGISRKFQKSARDNPTYGRPTRCCPAGR